MVSPNLIRGVALPLSRRRFVQGLVTGATLLPSLNRISWGAEPGTASILTGSEFRLSVGEMPVNFTGHARVATAINGQVPAPLLRMRQGELVTIHVTNRLRSQSSIHWHGITLPAQMDGVPGLSFPGIGAGETFVYRFRLNQSGTYWYHSHSRFQEQVGLYGPLVIEPAGGERHGSDREHVILLSDWSDLDPEHIFATLKRQSDYFNYGKRTTADLLSDVRAQGWKATLADRRMWGAMRMNPTDLADVGGATYTYLMNGTTPNGNWTGLFKRGERVRLRFINGSSMSIFDVRIPGLRLTVVAADGQDVEPVTVDEFRIGTAETLDVIVEPKDDRAYTVFAQSIDRSGFARGTLAPNAGMSAEVPALDARQLLTMADMGMDHGAHGGAHQQPPDGGSMDHGAMDHTAMDHGSMDHSAMDHAAPDDGAMDHSAMDHAAMGHAGMDHNTMSHATAPLNHKSHEKNPGVDATVVRASSNLNDPGPGLRNNGRRVLTYADLHTIGGALDRRDPGREIELHLTGHMERFMWSFDGEKFSQAKPIRFEYGERLRITLINDSMMIHPIHLHGMWSELEDEHGQFLVRKHTVMVQPAQRLSYLVTADALGRWAYHCHLLYHMEAGMFREVVVERREGGNS